MLTCSDLKSLSRDSGMVKSAASSPLRIVTPTHATTSSRLELVSAILGFEFSFDTERKEQLRLPWSREREHTPTKTPDASLHHNSQSQQKQEQEKNKN
eukprot:m.259178 g.259178  ORF g.259178 m.259178 type:complete len:98 (+) comp26770_c1_seq10:3208-3501(+)